MAQWPVVRMAIAKNRGLAELMTRPLHGERALDAADQLRVGEHAAEMSGRPSTFGRERSAFFPKGTFELTTGPHLSGLLKTVRRRSLWHSAKHTGFIPGFVADVDAVLARTTKRPSRCSPQARRGPTTPHYFWVGRFEYALAPGARRVLTEDKSGKVIR